MPCLLNPGTWQTLILWRPHQLLPWMSHVREMVQELGLSASECAAGSLLLPTCPPWFPLPWRTMPWLYLGPVTIEHLREQGSRLLDTGPKEAILNKD